MKSQYVQWQRPSPCREETSIRLDCNNGYEQTDKSARFNTGSRGGRPHGRCRTMQLPKMAARAGEGVIGHAAPGLLNTVASKDWATDRRDTAESPNPSLASRQYMLPLTPARKQTWTIPQRSDKAIDRYWSLALIPNLHMKHRGYATQTTAAQPQAAAPPSRAVRYGSRKASLTWLAAP